ncbi:hypothetical protein E4T47_04369 [Aureobasidium subglaciale]|nr:hypothetical protein E4T47_04369 [Aureobasidium subglaciale]
MTTSGTEFLEQAFDDGYNAEQYFDGGNDEEFPNYSSTTLYKENVEMPVEFSQGVDRSARAVPLTAEEKTSSRTFRLSSELFTFDQLYCLHRETTSNEFGGFIEVAHREKRMAELEAFEAEIWVMAGR